MNFSSPLKKALFPFIISCVLSFCVFLLPAQAQRKHALLIGVHAYSHGPDSIFSDLNTESDVSAIRQVLIDKFGFADKDIKVLTTGPETTRAGLLQAMQEYLVSDTKLGDIVYFHYSGHGSQVPDENDPSGFDSTLVPSDWTQDGAKDIHDKEIKALIAQIKEKHPANLTMTFDSCHSGTVTRGGRMLVRGVSLAKRFGTTAAAAMLQKATKHSDSASAAVQNGAFGGLTSENDQVGQTNFVVISACRDDQSAVETEDENHIPMGRLTFLLCGALRTASANTTYQDLFERIDSLMRQQYTDTRQDPQIEGDSHEVLLGSSAIITPPYLLVENNLGSGPRLLAGSLQGMTVGSVFSIYPAGSKEFTPAAQIATARILSARLLSSKLEIINKVRPDVSLSAARAIEVSHEYGDIRLKVSVDGLGADDIAVVNALKANPAISVVMKTETPDVSLAHDGASLTLTRDDGGASIGRFAAGTDQVDQVSAALKREVKWRFVRALNNDDPNSPLQIAIRVAPASVTGNDDEGYTFVGDKPLARGPLSLSDSDSCTIEVRNAGTVDAYVAMLDVQNDGSVQQLWPTAEQTVSESLIPHGQPDRWQKLMQDPTHPMIVRFAGCRGPETFKAIATREKVDFKTLTTRDSLSPLEKLLRSASTGTRAQVSVTPSLWSTATVAFTVMPNPAPK